jgi:ABC-type branched-subunit amino acid transport system substrate-binding protein
MKKLLGPDIDGLVFASDVESQYSDAPAMREANELIAKHFPGAAIDYNSMVGYGEGKILVHALEASGRDLTRDKFVASLDAMSDFDAGVLPVSFSPTKHVAAKSVKIFRWQGGKPEPQSDWVPIVGESK